MQEKRFYVRIPSNIACTCTYLDEKIPGTIVDFSRDGMRLLVNATRPYSFKVGSSIRVRYYTSMELGDTLAPIIIKCDVDVRHVNYKSGKFPYMYQIGCRIENTVDAWN